MVQLGKVKHEYLSLLICKFMCEWNYSFSTPHVFMTWCLDKVSSVRLDVFVYENDTGDSNYM